jgi:hypothetical protein
MRIELGVVGIEPTWRLARVVFGNRTLRGVEPHPRPLDDGIEPPTKPLTPVFSMRLL